MPPRQRAEPAKGTKADPPPADPLADLREPAPGEAPPVPGNSEEPAAEPEPVTVEVRAMVSEETQDQMVAEVVAAWHADPTSQGFLHGGGSCGCRYMARVALQATVPVMAPEDWEERDLEPSHG